MSLALAFGRHLGEWKEPIGLLTNHNPDLPHVPR